MYYIIETLLPLIIALLGAYMFVQPVKSTKEELRDDEAAIQKTKKNGLILTIVGAIVFVIMLVVNFVM